MNIINSWQNTNSDLHRKYIGNISMHHVLEATLELHEHPQFASLRYIIEDYTEATNTPFKHKDLKDFSNVVNLRSRTKRNLKIAIVSRNTAESSITAIDFCEFMRQCHYQCEVFYTFPDAQAWATAS